MQVTGCLLLVYLVLEAILPGLRY